MKDNRIKKPETEDQEDMLVLTRLLDCQTIQGTREEISHFRIRISELADLNGETWIRNNAQRLLVQWEVALKLNERGRHE